MEVLSLLNPKLLIVPSAKLWGSDDVHGSLFTVAPLAHSSVWHLQKWLKGSCQQMRFYLPQTGVEPSWQQQHLHLTWDEFDQDKWNYVFLPFCQAPYLSESMQLPPTHGEREGMRVLPVQVNSNWTLSILPFLSLEQSEISSWLEGNMAYREQWR